ncbi:MAG TPA: peptidoglycan-binding protein, partial [Candidatus Limnocylindria bacterium]|nr:peptidoglycan-binding protein [Candidatus Limnocylindria bacterium]
AYYAQKGSLPIYRPLKLGDRGDEVRALKQRLFELGFLRSGNFNNRYHEEIVEAVRQFQQQNGLEATGIAGSLTLAKLYEGAAPSQVTTEPSASDSPFTVDPSADETPAPTPGATPQPTQEQDVTLNPGGPTGSPDAAATPGTTETPAPVDAQPPSATVRTGNSAALNVRERADSGSRLIVRIYNGTVVEVLERGDEWTRIRFQNQEGYVMTRYLRFITPSETPFLSQYRTLTLGDAGPEVLRLKQRFYELGYFRTKDFNDKYQQSTADTVRRFEQRNGLPADGIADPAMQELLFSSDARKP